VAYLNLENMYGTPQSVTKVLERAVQHNDSIAVYLQMINIYVTAGQPEVNHVTIFTGVLYGLRTLLIDTSVFHIHSCQRPLKNLDYLLVNEVTGSVDHLELLGK